MAGRIVKKFEKQPWESWIVGADYSKTFEDGEALVLGNCDLEVIDRNGEDASDVVLGGSLEVGTSPADKIRVTPKTNALLKRRVLGGVKADSPYKLTFKGVSDADNQSEEDIFMYINPI